MSGAARVGVSLSCPVTDEVWAHVAPWPFSVRRVLVMVWFSLIEILVSGVYFP